MFGLKSIDSTFENLNEQRKNAFALSLALTRLGVGQVVHALGDGRQQNLGFLLQAAFFDDGGDDLDAEFSILLHLVLDAEYQPLAELVLVKQV